MLYVSAVGGVVASCQGEGTWADENAHSRRTTKFFFEDYEIIQQLYV